MDCASISAELQANSVRKELLAERSMNMLGGAFWFEDQASKAAALDARNRHLAAMGAQKGCRR